jgi:hypothetical protein
VDQPIADRRTDARFPPPADAATRVTLRPGCVVFIVDVSAGGALVEAGRPLRPGARVHVQLVAGARAFAVAAHVLRCAVWSLDRDNGVKYRGALKFEHRCDWTWGGGAGAESRLVGAPSSSDRGHASSGGRHASVRERRTAK